MKKQQHCHPNPPSLAEKLRSNARKLTGPRRAIVELLQEQDHPLTIKEITAGLDNSCDLATIYRSMHLLEELAMVQRFDFGDGVARYELVHDEHHAHHHHLICRSCAKVVEIEDCFPKELEDRIAGANGFTAVSHKLEFFGVCPSCNVK